VDTISKTDLIRWEKGTCSPQQMALVREEPLSIRIQGKPYSVVMRTPGDEIAHVAGFCLAEGIIDSPSDYTSIGFCEGEQTNVVTITLTADRRAQIPQILDRRNFVSQTSCGLCGKEIVDDLYQLLRPMTAKTLINIDTAAAGLIDLSSHQPLRTRTRASHAAVLFNAAGDPLAAAEDVGRHNALDKAIGKLFVDHRLSEVGFAAVRRDLEMGASLPEIEKTVEALRRFDVQRIMLSHCTGLRVYAEMVKEFPGRVSWPGAGARVRFGGQ